MTLVFLRSDKDSEKAAPSWSAIRETIKITGDDNPHGAGSFTGVFSAGIINGKALRLVQPDYPARARQAHASGAVLVQITIDERAKVLSAEAKSGRPLLKPAAVAAARVSQFSVTRVCGEPVRVNGVIIYNFVPR